MDKRLVIITDCSDVAYSELRGTVFSQLQSKAKVQIEPAIDVSPLSIINGSFLLRLAAEAYPPGTVFSIVVNPLKQIAERVVIKTKNKNLTVFSTNTGILGWLIKDFGIKEAWKIKGVDFVPFGGKYVHAPAVAKYLSGQSLTKIGTRIDISKVRRLDIKKGTVVHIDNFGLIKINIDPQDLKIGQKYVVAFNGKSLQCTFVRRVMSLDDGTWAIYAGSSFGLLELGCARADKTKLLGIKIGDIVTIKQVK